LMPLVIFENIELRNIASKSFAKSGGVGISNDVFRTLILQQANRAG